MHTGSDIDLLLSAGSQLPTLRTSAKETDCLGWYGDNTVMPAVCFTLPTNQCSCGYKRPVSFRSGRFKGKRFSIFPSEENLVQFAVRESLFTDSQRLSAFLIDGCPGITDNTVDTFRCCNTGAFGIRSPAAECAISVRKPDATTDLDEQWVSLVKREAARLGAIPREEP